MAARLLYFHLWKQSRKLWQKVSFELREKLCWFYNKLRNSILKERLWMHCHWFSFDRRFTCPWSMRTTWLHHSTAVASLGGVFFLSAEPRSCVKHNCTHIPHSMCFMYSGKRHCKCIQACTSEQAEVCGSDRRTYRNECHLKRTACVNKENVHVLKHGSCPAGKGKEICLEFTEISWIVYLCNAHSKASSSV